MQRNRSNAFTRWTPVRQGARMLPRLLALLLLASGVTAASCSVPPEPGSGLEVVTVELDAYSGRPNPAWMLSSGEADALAELLAPLPRVSGPTMRESNLGYRGFAIRNPGGDGGIPEELYVSRSGVVEIVRGAGRGETLRDETGVESYLLGLARDHGHGVERE